MHDIKQLMQDHYLRYASYVILDRAIPHIVDGLKPVQRRILHTLWKMHDKRFHKVANVAGQTMAYHPHGEAAIYEALVQIANKEYLLERQGNFGNLLTGDSAAAARYIETKLSDLAVEAVFNPKQTEYVPSYDGRNKEPVVLPVKIPLLLLHGAEGIAVGMATKIFPHNFVELLEAEIALLEGRSIKVFPDFLAGGIMDVSEYADGLGKIQLRARIEVPDLKTVVITELCYGTTTESVITSIEEAAKKGKLKIDAIHDYTADTVAIEIKLSRGQYAKDLIELLYAYTNCEVSLTPQMIVIKDDLPCVMAVSEILEYNVRQLKTILERELQDDLDALTQLIFDKTLEQIFIENKLYKNIEEVGTQEAVYNVLEESFLPYLDTLYRRPVKDDYDRLLAIPIRRIARFDREKNDTDIRKAEKERAVIEKHLKSSTKYAIKYLQNLINTYGKNFPRRTKIEEISQIDKRALAKKDVVVRFDQDFFGTKVSSGKELLATAFDKILIMYKSGLYKVVNIQEKQYVGRENDPVLYVGIADKTTVFSVLYTMDETKQPCAKRFIIKQFILDKEYKFLEEGETLAYFTDQPGKEVVLHFIPKAKQKVGLLEYSLDTALVKNVVAKGVRVTSRSVMKVEEKQKEHVGKWTVI